MHIKKIPRASRSCEMCLTIGKVSSVIVLSVACAVASGTLNAHAQLSVDREYQIKAAILYNFAKFVQWPAEALPETSTTITIGVLGEDPFGAALESIQGKTVRGKTLVINRFKGLQDLTFSHILFISSSEKAHLAQVMQTLNHSGILTVGEMQQFAELGGIINLTIAKNTVRFEINVGSAERAGLKISSELLKLAKVVGGAH